MTKARRVDVVHVDDLGLMSLRCSEDLWILP
jgi:hypothetical protein